MYLILNLCYEVGEIKTKARKASVQIFSGENTKAENWKTEEENHKGITLLTTYFCVKFKKKWFIFNIENNIINQSYVVSRVNII